MALRNRIVLALAATASIAVLAGCASTPADSGARSVDAADLVGTWTIDESFDSPEQPFIDFVDDNTWTASDGCNRMQGTWKLGDEGAITTTSGASTLMYCGGAQLPLAISMAEKVSIDGDELTILSSHDSTTTVLIRSTDDSVGPLGQPIGQWVESDDEGAPFLSLSADGKFTGNDGCNTLMGEWEVLDDGAVQFGAVASTRMFCDGVDTWLSTVALGRIQGSLLTLQDTEGTVIGQLTSQP